VSDLIAFLSARTDEAEAAAQDEHALREVKARRKILAMATINREMTQELLRRNPPPDDPDMIAATSAAAIISLVLIALAEVDRDHPDYDPAWVLEGGSAQ
jgi:Family of unknown function (DUF6221)